MPSEIINVPLEVPGVPPEVSNVMDFLTTDTVVGISAVFIALCALGVSVWTGWLTRRHNRLSVRPHLILTYNWVSPNPFAITLANEGTGPAWVKSRELRVDGTSIHSMTIVGWEAAMRQLGLKNIQFDCHSLGIDDAVAVGATRTLLNIPKAHEIPGGREKIFEAFRRLEIRIQYSSIYGEKYNVLPLTDEQLK